jgi:hypothetical protein
VVLENAMALQHDATIAGDGISVWTHRMQLVTTEK